MSTIKTLVSEASVADFINSYADTDQKRQDSFELLRIMESYTGYTAKLWGTSIIGFGSYHYKSEKSTQEGDCPLVGFSPRKAAISLYVYADSPENARLLKELGKFKMGKACIYVKKLSDINIDVLEKMIAESTTRLKERHPDKG